MQRGDLAEAEIWWRSAAEAGNTATAAGLGVLLERRGDLAGAETWYRTAAEAGNTTAAGFEDADNTKLTRQTRSHTYCFLSR